MKNPVNVTVNGNEILPDEDYFVIQKMLMSNKENVEMIKKTELIKGKIDNYRKRKNHKKNIIASVFAFATCMISLIFLYVLIYKNLIIPMTANLNDSMFIGITVFLGLALYFPIYGIYSYITNQLFDGADYTKDKNE